MRNNPSLLPMKQMQIPVRANRGVKQSCTCSHSRTRIETLGKESGMQTHGLLVLIMTVLCAQSTALLMKLDAAVVATLNALAW